MKKTIGLMTCLLLGACDTPALIVKKGAQPGTQYPLQYAAPLPWIRVVPSDRTIAFKEVDFNALAQQLRFSLSYYPHLLVFKNVRLVTIDYTVLPYDTSGSPVAPPIAPKGPTSSYQYEARPKRYVLNVSFYECDKLPPTEPWREVTVFMRVDKAPPQEALRLMLHSLVEDIHADSENPNPQRKFEVSLD